MITSIFFTALFLVLLLVSIAGVTDFFVNFSYDVYDRIVNKAEMSLEEMGMDTKHWQVGDAIHHYPPTVTKYQKKEVVANYLIHFDNKTVCLSSNPTPKEHNVFFLPAALIVKNSSADKRSSLNKMDAYHREIHPMLGGKDPSPFVQKGRLLMGHTDEYETADDCDLQTATPVYSRYNL